MLQQLELLSQELRETEAERAGLIRAADELAIPKKKIAEAMGIKRSTLYEWMKRARAS